ncbi:hypothetical protein ABBQ32_013054 [Trebouxia sp. C0010 RCD-2024]
MALQTDGLNRWFTLPEEEALECAPTPKLTQPPHLNKHRRRRKGWTGRQRPAYDTARMVAKQAPKARRWRQHERRAQLNATTPAQTAPSIGSSCSALLQLAHVMAVACEKVLMQQDLVHRTAELNKLKDTHQALQHHMCSNEQQLKQQLRDQAEQHRSALSQHMAATEAAVTDANQKTDIANAAANSANAAAAAAEAALNSLQLDCENLPSSADFEQLQRDSLQQLWQWQQAYQNLQAAYVTLQNAAGHRLTAQQEAQSHVAVLQEQLSDLHYHYQACQHDLQQAEQNLQHAKHNLQQADCTAARLNQEVAELLERLQPVHIAEEQAVPLGSGANGQVEAADNLLFGPHVYKWGRAGEDLEGEGMTLLKLQSPHIVQCFGRCREGPGVTQPRHPGCTGLIMERMEMDLHQVLVLASVDFA